MAFYSISETFKCNVFVRQRGGICKLCKIVCVCVCLCIFFTVGLSIQTKWKVLSSAYSLVHMITSQYKDRNSEKLLLISPAAHSMAPCSVEPHVLHHHGLLAQGSL